jgi:hypothetical protein
MRAALLVLVALAGTGCMGDSNSGNSTHNTNTGNGGNTVPTPGSRGTKLDISVSIGGSEAPTKVWTLRCPNRGTLPKPRTACANLSLLDKPFAPVGKHEACTQIYGGPETADVTGTFRGKPVNAHFERSNGCEIARWDRVKFLFPTS